MFTRCIFILIITVAPKISDAQLQTLIITENNFAHLSKEKSIRDAFLANLDDSSIVFNDGLSMYGKPVWEKRTQNNSYLFWWPEVADISSSGDLGYTTGPCEWGNDKNNPHPSGGAYYATVWKKNSKGNWKIAVDLGSAVHDTSERTSTPILSQKSEVHSEKINNGHSDREIFINADKSYNDQLNDDKVSFLVKNLSSNARLYRPNSRPMIKPESIRSNIRMEASKKFSFIQAGAGISKSGDLAYSYGNVKISQLKDGKDDIVKSNYLRVWKKEDGQNWQIVLDVIGQ